MVTLVSSRVPSLLTIDRFFTSYQVFEGRSTFYSSLESRARQVVKEKYDLEPDWDFCYGQAAYQRHVSKAARQLLDTSGFMHYGIDDQVRHWIFWVALLMMNFRGREIILTTWPWKSWPLAFSMAQQTLWVFFSQRRWVIRYRLLVLPWHARL
jgi:hypothetical protein